MKKIAVYCGSSNGNNPVFMEAAKALGEKMLEREIGLVYGAGSTGLMGHLAQTILDGGGEVVGITPGFFMGHDVIHENLTELLVVETMHERKKMMADLADASIALPGGLGTLDELMEILTWIQLGIHEKPCGVLNVQGYYDGLFVFLKYVVQQGFVKQEHVDNLIAHKDVGKLIENLAGF